MHARTPVLFASALLAGIATCDVGAAVTVFTNDLAGFNAAAGNPPIVVDFDSIPANTDITGSTINGVTLLGPGSALIVVAGKDTFTPRGFGGAPNPEMNKLLPTTDDNVLSPGGLELGPGPNPALEDDRLTLIFAAPVSAFGFDHLSQSCDGAGYTFIQVFDASEALLFSGSVPISNLGGGGAPACADFWGIVSTERNIAQITIVESDGDSQFPDSNIGLDTIRLAAGGCTGSPDINGDGIVNGADLGILLGAWGTSDCAADLNGDGNVDGADLGVLLGAWTG